MTIKTDESLVIQPTALESRGSRTLKWIKRKSLEISWGKRTFQKIFKFHFTYINKRVVHLKELKVHSKVLEENSGVIIKTLIFDGLTFNYNSNTAIMNVTINYTLSAKRFDSSYNPANIYLFKVNNWKTRKGCEICSKLTIKRHFSSVSIVGFEQVNVSW